MEKEREMILEEGKEPKIEKETVINSGIITITNENRISMLKVETEKGEE